MNTDKKTVNDDKIRPDKIRDLVRKLLREASTLVNHDGVDYDATRQAGLLIDCSEVLLSLVPDAAQPTLEGVNPKDIPKYVGMLCTVHGKEGVILKPACDTQTWWPVLIWDSMKVQKSHPRYITPHEDRPRLRLPDGLSITG